MNLDEELKIINMEYKHIPYMVKWKNNIPKTRFVLDKKKTNISIQESIFNKKENYLNIFLAILKSNPVGFAEINIYGDIIKIANISTYADKSSPVDTEYYINKSIIDMCKNDFGVDKITTQALAADVYLLDLYERLGFNIELKRRNHYFSEGKYHHLLEMAYLI